MDEVDLMRTIGSLVPPRDDEARSRARARLEARIAEETLPKPRGSLGPNRGRVLAAAAVVALVVVVLVIQAILPPGRGGPDAAQATLEELALVAEGHESPALPTGQFFYVRSTTLITQTSTDISLGESWTFLVQVEREKWLASDGSGRILERFGRPRFVSPEDRQAWLEAGSPRLLPHGPRYNQPFGPGELAPRDLGAIPRDPDALANLIAAGGAVGTAEQVPDDPLDVVADLLGEVPASSDLRSAVFRATALIPGIETRAEVLDPLNREGTVIILIRAGVRTDLLFDPQSSALLARIVTRLDADGQPTHVIEKTSYVERSVVDSAQARP